MRELSEAARTAQAIRKELKAKYPRQRFRVRSENFAGGDAVNISWTDGPAIDEINELVAKYEYGRFDAMTDSYEYDNKRDDVPQVKYVTAQRELSDAFVKAFRDYYRDLYDVEDAPDDLNKNFVLGGYYTTWRQLAWREASNKSAYDKPLALVFPRFKTPVHPSDDDDFKDALEALINGVREEVAPELFETYILFAIGYLRGTLTVEEVKQEVEA